MASSTLLTGWLVCALAAFVAGMSVQKPAQSYGEKVDCKVGKWSDWSICSVSCGSGGIQQRHRDVLIPSAHGGAACPPLDESRPCSAGLCDVPSTTPSYPETTTTISYETTTEFSDVTEATTLMPVDCKVSKFSKWSLCSAMPCGEGTQQRRRTILVLSSNSGAACPPLSESRPCKKTCKTTTTVAYPETTVRVETEPTSYATTTLKEETEAIAYQTTTAFSEPTEETTTAYQPVDCKVSKWSKWSLCSAIPCGDGLQERHRTVISQPSHGGAICPPLSDSRPCHKICDVPSTTTIDYPESTEPTTYATTVFSEPTTTAYATTLKAETEATTFYLKPVDCVVSKWSHWSHCSGAPCGSGFEERHRSILIQPINGGHACPSLKESRPCNLICEQPATTTNYATTVFSEPTTTQYATPTVFSLPTETTTYKPRAAYRRLRRAVANNYEQQQADETEPTTYATTAFSDEPTTTTAYPTTTILPVDCKVTKWSKWSLCSAMPCGEGIQERHRTIRERPSNGGAFCPPLTESRPCQKICDVPSTTIDYETTVFSEPTTTDYQTTAQIETETPLTTDYTTTLKAEPETTTQSPVDCKVSKWSKWSKCSSKPCGEGIQHQTRKIIVLPAFGGIECPILEHTRPCHVACPTTSTYEATTLKAETETTPAYPTTTSGYETTTKFREPTAPKVLYRKRRDAYIETTTKLQDETTTDYATPSMNDDVEQPEKTTFFYSTTRKPEYDCNNKADGAYPTSQCAAKYFVCDNGATSVLLCPDQLRFDVDLKLCNRPEEMPKCGGIKPRIEKPLNDFKELPKVQFDCTGKADGYYPEAKCSNTYFSCTGGLARELHCQPGLVYSQSESACEGRNIAFECTGIRPTPTTTTMRSPISTTAPLYKCFGKADGNYAAGNCESFYFVCTGGRATKQSCPPGLLRFDAELNQCNAKAHVPSCGGQRPTTVEQIQPEATTPAPVDCQRRPDGNIANPLAACSELYYTCSYGKAFAKSCPGGLFFNIAGGHCDFKSKISACKGSLLDDILTTPKSARKHRPQTTTYQPQGEQQQQQVSLE